MKSIYSIDLEKDILGSDEQKENFIKALLYPSKYTEEKEKLGNYQRYCTAK